MKQLLLALLIAFPAAAQVDLYVVTFPPPVVDAGLPFELLVTYANRGAADAHAVVLTVRGPAGPFTYSIGDLPGVGANGIPDFKTLRLDMIAPDESARTIPISLQIKGDVEDAEASDNVHEAVTRTYRTYFVINADDRGSGSLRAAIETANGDCREAGFCKIAFRIAPAAAPTWHTITPKSLLPVITAPNIRIDASVQSRYFADMNPDGPEIELHGAIENGGHGLEAACGASVHGFAVNGFAGSGLHFSNGPCRPPDSARINDLRSIERNYLGTDPTGNIAIPNFRGVTFESAGAWLLHENVISGNLRSGVYVENSLVQITNNIIGLNATHTAPLGNGASGVYLGAKSFGSDVADNYIGFNGHYGIALHRENSYTAMPANSFQANGNLAIDYGLDGPTAEVPDAGGITPVRRPVITSARYDAAQNETIVEGTSDTQNERYEVWVYVYANDEPDPSGYGEGQYYLGKVKANDDRSFTFRYKGRSPGRWIAAATTRINIIGFLRTPGADSISGSGFTSTTSEFGRTVEIQ
jgi:Periplasmic copper-binding protein (NosD)